ncbi:histidine phosphatase family protein [uncultured Psychromonas sp.]|uniref:histidine phosphatase family protein n=1 Tax=uncultured Psychromonas sp. TaxID=173974 RepID=UPI002619F705|nr:histidine phosphatase family protein [uncultured Psychromonas sp.]
MTDLYLIRHGETLFNQLGCFQGHSDSPLTETGHLQASNLISYFNNIPLQQFYSSDLGRAVATATPLAKAKQLPLQTCPLLREISYDYLDGQAKRQLTDKDREKLTRLFSAKLDYRIGEGETLAEVQTRLFDKINALNKLHKGQSIAVMTHGLSIVMLIKKILQIPVDAPRMFNVHNASVCHLSFRSGQWVLQSIERNDVG